MNIKLFPVGRRVCALVGPDVETGLPVSAQLRRKRCAISLRRSKAIALNCPKSKAISGDRSSRS